MLGINLKFFPSTNGSKEVLSVITTLESIEGLVIKKLRRGSLKIETNLHKMSALKLLINHFESGNYIILFSMYELDFCFNSVLLFEIHPLSLKRLLILMN